MRDVSCELLATPCPGKRVPVPARLSMLFTVVRAMLIRTGDRLVVAWFDLVLFISSAEALVAMSEAEKYL